MVQEKKIVEEVSGWLRVYDDGSIDRTWTGPPQVSFMAEPVMPHEKFIDGVAVKDVDTDSGFRVRIYLPEKKITDSETLPIILHFHGGGFCISEASWYMYYAVYTRLARTSCSIVVSVYLPRAPEHRLLAACEESYHALLWLRSLARGDMHEKWLNEHADFTRVFLIGDSSGGNLVHEIAARAGNEELSPLRLAGGIPVHPGFVRATRSKSELEQPQSPFLTLDMLDRFLNFALPLGSTKDHPITCPMGDAAPPISSLKMPPMMLCVAETDLIIDTEMEYYEAMKKAGKDFELFLSAGVGHTFYLNKIAVDLDEVTATRTQELIAAISEFIKRH
ncbi:putative carboxylesterase 15 [Heracleum sosnowskyi]|uniref:Carboxylesterase 15 n=1 Tax=Heracleum sosnowskyi TaxID=360622 RepID=A0AAD8ICF0_9APIA|nr:putative carboxylesterase 15 [Heracleum sosnowskyi]